MNSPEQCQKSGDNLIEYDRIRHGRRCYKDCDTKGREQNQSNRRPVRCKIRRIQNRKAERDCTLGRNLIAATSGYFTGR